ncbi:MAG: hypothetical protein WC209_00870 [Ignavibacteriaceae bacterium]|jgi:hypothetical protein
MVSEYFDGFNWALPKAFAEALSKCLFEVGDIIYDTQKAYSIPWNEAKKVVKHSIQIKSISSPNLYLEEKNNESIFNENWDSEVVFDYYDYHSLNKIEISTTQGRLYSLLWKGNEEYILSANIPATKPCMLKSVFKKIADYKLEISKLSDPNCEYLFYFPVDVANQTFNEKSKKIIKSFKSNVDLISYRIKSYSPQNLNSNTSLTLCPTLKFIVFEISGSSESINEALKKALYIQSKNKKSEKEYFRLKAHGALFRKY